ncbi:LON peptidase substrate-binding domain-containing protein [Rapidithrix thailandica]|uniref:LON peptidase substrate-binding domain-containing protein n=1 Tax=Rapidithrix thailandica TaxID=413964 RepID=A0AAW9RPC4_9BACT
MVFLPLFPLNIVVFPQESLHLHIFESRYKQLIQDCIEGEHSFGIPVYFDNKLREYGTEIHVDKIVNTYEDGRMDIVVRGERVFRVINWINPIKNKLYAGGEVEFITLEEDASWPEREELLAVAEELFELLQLPEQELTNESGFLSFRIAHFVGFSLQEEFQLLTYKSEHQRIQVLLKHLSQTLPLIKEWERVRAIAQMNGHFRHFDPLNF